MASYRGSTRFLSSEGPVWQRKVLDCLSKSARLCVPASSVRFL